MRKVSCDTFKFKIVIAIRFGDVDDGRLQGKILFELIFLGGIDKVEGEF